MRHLLQNIFTRWRALASLPPPPRLDPIAIRLSRETWMSYSEAKRRLDAANGDGARAKAAWASDVSLGKA